MMSGNRHLRHRASEGSHPRRCVGTNPRTQSRPEIPASSLTRRRYPTGRLSTTRALTAARPAIPTQRERRASSARAPRSEDDYDGDDRNRAEGHGDRRRQKLANGVAYHARALRQEGFWFSKASATASDTVAVSCSEHGRISRGLSLGDRYGPQTTALSTHDGSSRRNGSVSARAPERTGEWRRFTCIRTLSGARRITAVGSPRASRKCAPSSSATSPSAARSALPSPRTGAARRWSTCGAAAALPTGDAPWNEDTMVVVNSTTKGLAAMTLAVANSRGWIDYDSPVAELLARVRPERQGRDHRSPAPQPRGRAGLDRRAAAPRGYARPRLRRRARSRARSRRGNREHDTATTR